MDLKVKRIGLYALSVLVLIAAVPLVTNDILLLSLYFIAAAILIVLTHERNDYAAYFIGLIGISVAEFFFIQTGVETFSRAGLLGMMPVWLPFLWAYSFVVIKRSLKILDKKERK